MPYAMAIVFMILSGSLLVGNPVYNYLIYIGFASPFIAAIIVVYRFYSIKEKKSYWTSMVDIRRISWKVLLFIFLFPIGIRWLAALGVGQFVNSGFQFSFSPEMSLNYTLVLFFLGPLPEEMGWRGVALPALQKRFGFRIGIIYLGLLWAAWHLPLFFFQDTYQFQLGLWTPLFWNFMLNAFFTSMILAVLFDTSGNSILAVILFHYMDNLTGESIVITNSARIFSTAILGIVAIGLMIFYREK